MFLKDKMYMIEVSFQKETLMHGKYQAKVLGNDNSNHLKLKFVEKVLYTSNAKVIS